MGLDLTCRRYRALYARLLRLYPQPFYERFGEGMRQTFGDLCRERRTAGRGVLGMAAWVFFETLTAIARENAIHMTELSKTTLRVAAGALVALMVPLVASQVVEGWNWPPGAFVFVYVLFFLTGMAYALIARKMGAWEYKAGVGLALAAGFVLGWSNMVHMSEAENPAYLVYFGVLVLGVVGAWLVKLRTPDLARLLFAMAVTMAVLAVGQAAFRVEGPGGIQRIDVGHGVLAVVFAVSGMLFRRAGLAGAE